MITEEQLRELYDNEIGITLKAMEGQRLLIKWGIVAILVIFAGIVITNITYNPPMFVFIISGVVWISFAAFVAIKARDYTLKYKKEVIGKIISTLKPDWAYNPEKTITRSVFDKSGLVRINYDRFEGDDRITGKINETPILLTDFKLQEKRTSRSKNGGSKTYYKTLFNGLFLQIDFGKRFIGNTYITPQRKKGKQSTDPIYIKEKPAIKDGFFKSIMNTNTYEIPFIPVKHASFPEMFTLHSTNPPSQLHVINKGLLDYLTKAQKMVDYPLHFSFAQTHVNCVIDMPDPMFEPKIFTSPAKYEEVKFIYDVFLLVETIVRIFDKNKEAWE